MLTARRERFIQEYLVDLCATRAAIRAGYSRRTANVQGPRLTKNDEIRTAIKAAMDERARRIGIRSDDILSEISRVALHRIVVGLGTCYDPKIRMRSKQKALDQLKRHLGPYGDKVQAACFDHFVERVQASSAEVSVADRERPHQAAPSPADAHCDWLPPGPADADAPVTLPQASVPVAPAPTPYRPIMPLLEPNPWPSICGQVAIDYDVHNEGGD